MESKNHFEDVFASAEMDTVEKEIVLASDTADNSAEATVQETTDIISDTDIAEETEAFIKQQETVKTATRVNEIPELREENCKVFSMSDGTEQAVFYTEPIHVFDEETQCFTPVDVTITEKDGSFVGGKNRFTAEFGKKDSDDELFNISDGSHRIKVMPLKNSKKKTAKLLPKLIKMNAVAEENAAKIHKAADKVVFEEEDGVSFNYSLTGNGVKEDIVIKEKAEVYRYPFILRCENVAVKFDEEENHVTFEDIETGNEVFYIPAPFMTDESGAASAAVSYDIRELEGGDILLTVTADSEWINAEERVFPVVIDPQINVNSSGAMTTYSWVDGKMFSAFSHTVGTGDSGDGDCNVSRMYIKLKMPALPRNPRIKKAELQIKQASCSVQEYVYPKFGLYQVKENIISGTCTPAASPDLIDYDTIDTRGSGVTYSFDITKLFDAANKSEISYANLVLKMLDETCCCNNMSLYGSSYTASTLTPKLIVTYESSYGVNTSYRTHTHELGRFGQGSIDLACGNLMLESEDFAWSGNRMPVTIRHLYNSALASYQYTYNNTIKLRTASFDSMKLGYGFKLNLMQSMTYISRLPFDLEENEEASGYVYIGENGDEIYFKQSDKTCICKSNTQCYNLYESMNGQELYYDPELRKLTNGSDTYRFDSEGRLVKITDENGNSMIITYTSGRITSVTDGAGRVFGFSYNSGGFLTSITAPDGTNILYTYSGNLLSTVTYPNGKKAAITYSSNKPTAILLSDNGINVYRVNYSYSGNRVASVTEYGVDSGVYMVGASTSYSYSAASRRTVATTTEQADDGDAANVINTVYSFDNDGNIVGEYVYSEDADNTGVEAGASGINPYSGSGSVVINNNNLLADHNFGSLDSWTNMSANLSDFSITSLLNESRTKFGKNLIIMHSKQENCTNNGVYQLTNSLAAGEYTFSAYVKVMTEFTGTDDPGAYIRVRTEGGTVLAESEHISKFDHDYVRLVAPFTLTCDQNVRIEILVDGKGAADINAAQLESNPFANAYNILENGSFERGLNNWDRTAGVYSVGNSVFNMNRSIQMRGGLDSSRYAKQNVTVKTGRNTRETFTLSGWAKGDGIVNRERNNANAPRFCLRAVIRYFDTYFKEYGSETYTADFSPCTEEWQFASIQFAKKKFRMIYNITVYCDYSYNIGTAYFDNVQLVRDNIETHLSAEDFVETSTDTGDSADGSEDTAADNTPAFNEAKDAFGNALTETTFTDGEFGTIYRSFGYNTDNTQLAGNDTGNNLVRETDARGNKTEYTVDSETSRNEEVTDRLGNKTAYEYDASGRTTKVTSKNSCCVELADVSYKYDAFDNMTEIARGDGMKYSLAYNAFHNLESIGIDGKTEKLINYEYKNGNGRLKQITYANGDKMKATYNSTGQMIAEKWYNASNTLTAHYKYAYDGQGNIVRSIDMLSKVEYTYTYENGKIVRIAESIITLAGEAVTGKTLTNSVIYSYDSDGKLTGKQIIPVGGTKYVINYTNTDDGTVANFTVNGRTVTSHSKTDSFGRKEFDELQLGTGFVSRQFHYHTGDATDEHKEAAKLKSSPTTQLVSQIVMSDGRTISYEYDKEERITKVTDSVDGITEYTYDALGQLLREKKDGTAVNVMTYDNYGNIKSKNGVAYTYGDGVWKDLLTKVGDETISYDKQGNPTSYLGHTLTWEKGRQLKSFGNLSYTYNANGIRTSKTNNGVKHTYTLEGTKILRETYGNTTLVPMYDNEDSICGIIYNNVPYYFKKNLQGDIIAIVDKDAKEVARYSYDAWGACTVVSASNVIGYANPFRYRGYYYDIENKLYYLNSRYYDPAVGRFINADSIDFIGKASNSIENNLYTYCYNSSPNYIDNIGYFAITISLSTLVAILALFTFTFLYFFDYKFRSLVNQLITSIIMLAVNGIGYLANVISDVIDKARKGRKYNNNEVHHIVAQADTRAFLTQKLLMDNGLTVQHPSNLVSIKNTLHRHLHTNAYIAAVDMVLRACAATKRTKNDRKYAIIAGLTMIGTFLKAASCIV